MNVGVSKEKITTLTHTIVQKTTGYALLRCACYADRTQSTKCAYNTEYTDTYVHMYVGTHMHMSMQAYTHALI